MYYATVSTANAGSSSDARLDLKLPAGFTVTKTYADRGPGCSGSGQTLTCDVAWISPGVPTHVTVSGTVAQAGALDASATVTSLLEPDPSSANNTVTLTLQPQATGGGGTPAPTLAVMTKPSVAGIPLVGRTLHGIAGSWTTTPTQIVYRWQRCVRSACTAIANATGKTYRLRRSDAGRRIRFVEVAYAQAERVMSASPAVEVRMPPIVRRRASKAH